jgi:hypothetical protein
VRRADLFIGLGLLAFAGAYYWASFDIAMGFASDRLGPTFFPRLLAAALAAWPCARWGTRWPRRSSWPP